MAQKDNLANPAAQNDNLTAQNDNLANPSAQNDNLTAQKASQSGGPE